MNLPTGFPISFKRKEILLLFILYSASFVFLLLNTGIFWDDYVVAGQNKADILQMFSDSGRPWFGYLLFGFMKVPYFEIVYKILTFIGYFGCTLFVYESAKNFSVFTKEDRLILAILFSIAPLNFARITFSCSLYSFCYFMFFAGIFLLFRKSRVKQGLLLRIISYFCLSLAFLTDSLTLFYGFFILVLLLNESFNGQKFRLNDLGSSILRNLDYLILPCLFYLVKSRFSHVSGLYSEYNKLDISSIPFIWKAEFHLTAIKSLWLQFFSIPLSVISIGSIVIAACILFVLYLFGFLSKKENGKLQHYFMIFAAGLFCYLFSVIPYFLVEKVPAYEDWHSRHQLLMPLSVALICVGFTGVFIGIPFIRKGILVCLVILFSLSDIHEYHLLLIDSFKQEALVENIKNSPEIKDHTCFLVDDHTSYFNSQARDYRFYELNAFMKRSFGTVNRFCVLRTEFSRALKNDIQNAEVFTHHGQYNMRDFQTRNPEYLISILPGTNNMDKLTQINVVMGKLFNTKESKDKITHMVVLQMKKL